MKTKRKYNLITLAFLLPWIITFIIFSAYPIIFFDWDKFYRLFRVKPGDELCWFKKNYTALFKGEIFLKAMKTH